MEEELLLARAFLGERAEGLSDDDIISDYTNRFYPDGTPEGADLFSEIEAYSQAKIDERYKGSKLKGARDFLGDKSYSLTDKDLATQFLEKIPEDERGQFVGHVADDKLGQPLIDRINDFVLQRQAAATIGQAEINQEIDGTAEDATEGTLPAIDEGLDDIGLYNPNDEEDEGTSPGSVSEVVAESIPDYAREWENVLVGDTEAGREIKAELDSLTAETVRRKPELIRMAGSNIAAIKNSLLPALDSRAKTLEESVPKYNQMVESLNSKFAKYDEALQRTGDYREAEEETGILRSDLDAEAMNLKLFEDHLNSQGEQLKSESERLIALHDSSQSALDLVGRSVSDNSGAAPINYKSRYALAQTLNPSLRGWDDEYLDSYFRGQRIEDPSIPGPVIVGTDLYPASMSNEEMARQVEHDIIKHHADNKSIVAAKRIRDNLKKMDVFHKTARLLKQNKEEDVENPEKTLAQASSWGAAAEHMAREYIDAGFQSKWFGLSSENGRRELLSSTEMETKNRDAEGWRERSVSALSEGTINTVFTGGSLELGIKGGIVMHELDAIDSGQDAVAAEAETWLSDYAGEYLTPELQAEILEYKNAHGSGDEKAKAAIRKRVSDRIKKAGEEVLEYKLDIANLSEWRNKAFDEVIQNINKDDGKSSFQKMREIAAEYLKNPEEIVVASANSLPMSARSLIGGILGPAGAFVTSADTDSMLEMIGFVEERMAEQGLSLATEGHMEKFISEHPEEAKAAWGEALVHGIGVGASDALLVGIAKKAVGGPLKRVRAIERKSKLVNKKLLSIGTKYPASAMVLKGTLGIGGGSILEGTGEALAQLASRGKLDAADVVIEALAAGPTQTVMAYGGQSGLGLVTRKGRGRAANRFRGGLQQIQIEESTQKISALNQEKQSLLSQDVTDVKEVETVDRQIEAEEGKIAAAGIPMNRVQNADGSVTYFFDERNMLGVRDPKAVLDSARKDESEKSNVSWRLRHRDGGYSTGTGIDTLSSTLETRNQDFFDIESRIDSIRDRRDQGARRDTRQSTPILEDPSTFDESEVRAAHAEAARLQEDDSVSEEDKEVLKAIFGDPTVARDRAAGVDTPSASDLASRTKEVLATTEAGTSEILGRSRRGARSESLSRFFGLAERAQDLGIIESDLDVRGDQTDRAQALGSYGIEDGRSLSQLTPAEVNAISEQLEAQIADVESGKVQADTVMLGDDVYDVIRDPKDPNNIRYRKQGSRNSVPKTIAGQPNQKYADLQEAQANTEAQNQARLEQEASDAKRERQASANTPHGTDFEAHLLDSLGIREGTLGVQASDETRSTVQKIVDRLKLPFKVHIAQTPRDLPADMQARYIDLATDGKGVVNYKVRAIWDGKGNAYLIADHVNSVTELVSLIFHEAVVHGGIRAIKSQLANADPSSDIAIAWEKIEAAMDAMWENMSDDQFAQLMIRYGFGGTAQGNQIASILRGVIAARVGNDPKTIDYHVAQFIKVVRGEVSKRGAGYKPKSWSSMLKAMSDAIDNTDGGKELRHYLVEEHLAHRSEFILAAREAEGVARLIHAIKNYFKHLFTYARLPETGRKMRVTAAEEEAAIDIILNRIENDRALIASMIRNANSGVEDDTRGSRVPINTRYMNEFNDVVEIRNESGQLVAPNGRQSNLNQQQWRSVNTPSFQRWFGNSMAVDENGDPKVYYHGSTTAFDSFDVTRGEGFGAHFASNPSALDEKMTFPWEDPETLEYSEEAVDGANIAPVFLNYERPYRMHDQGSFTVYDMADELRHNDAIDSKRIEAMLEKIQSDGLLQNYTLEELLRLNQDAKIDTGDIVRQTLELAGYDSVVYLNRYEAVGTPLHEILRSNASTFLELGQLSEEEFVELQEHDQPLTMLKRFSDDRVKEMFPYAEESVIIFHPWRIKSGMGNRGGFDPSSRIITASRQTLKQQYIDDTASTTLFIQDTDAGALRSSIPVQDEKLVIQEGNKAILSWEPESMTQIDAYELGSEQSFSVTGYVHVPGKMLIGVLDGVQSNLVKPFVVVSRNHKQSLRNAEQHLRDNEVTPLARPVSISGLVGRVSKGGAVSFQPRKRTDRLPESPSYYDAPHDFKSPALQALDGVVPDALERFVQLEDVLYELITDAKGNVDIINRKTGNTLKRGGNKFNRIMDLRSRKQQRGRDENNGFVSDRRINEIAALLQSQTEEQQGVLVPTSRPEHRINRFVANAAADALYMYENAAGADAWFRDGVHNAVSILAGLVDVSDNYSHASLNDPVKADLFKMFLAFTSAGQPPSQNLKSLALRLWKEYEINGAVPETSADGKQWAPHLAPATIATFNRLVKDKGELGALEFLQTAHSVQDESATKYRDLNNYEKGKKNAGKNLLNKEAVLTDELEGHFYGSSVFGPKFGEFYQNLVGNYSLATKDAWFARTWNRYMGTLIENGETVHTPRDRVADQVDGMTERQVMQQAVNRLVDLLNRDGTGILSHKLEPADIQSLLWLFEQRLYISYGNRQSESGTYEDAARELANSELYQSAAEAIASLRGTAEAIAATEGIGQNVEEDVAQESSEPSTVAASRDLLEQEPFDPEASLAPVDGTPAGRDNTEIINTLRNEGLDNSQIVEILSDLDAAEGNRNLQAEYLADSLSSIDWSDASDMIDRSYGDGVESLDPTFMEEPHPAEGQEIGKQAEAFIRGEMGEVDPFDEEIITRGASLWIFRDGGLYGSVGDFSFEWGRNHHGDQMNLMSEYFGPDFMNKLVRPTQGQIAGDVQGFLSHTGAVRVAFVDERDDPRFEIASKPTAAQYEMMETLWHDVSEFDRFELEMVDQRTGDSVYHGDSQYQPVRSVRDMYTRLRNPKAKKLGALAQFRGSRVTLRSATPGRGSAFESDYAHAPDDVRAHYRGIVAQNIPNILSLGEIRVGMPNAVNGFVLLDEQSSSQHRQAAAGFYGLYTQSESISAVQMKPVSDPLLADGMRIDIGRQLTDEELVEVQDHLNQKNFEADGTIKPTDRHVGLYPSPFGLDIVNLDAEQEVFGNNIDFHQYVSTLPLDGGIALARASVETASNDWTKSSNGEEYANSIRKAYGSNTASLLNDIASVEQSRDGLFKQAEAELGFTRSGNPGLSAHNSSASAGRRAESIERSGIIALDNFGFYGNLRAYANNLSGTLDPGRVLKEIRESDEITAEEILFSGVEQYISGAVNNAHEEVTSVFGAREPVWSFEIPEEHKKIQDKLREMFGVVQDPAALTSAFSSTRSGFITDEGEFQALEATHANSINRAISVLQDEGEMTERERRSVIEQPAGVVVDYIQSTGNIRLQMYESLPGSRVEVNLHIGRPGFTQQQKIAVAKLLDLFPVKSMYVDVHDRGQAPHSFLIKPVEGIPTLDLGNMPEIEQAVEGKRRRRSKLADFRASREEAQNELKDILESMDVPEDNKDLSNHRNIRWLSRNLYANNSDHPKIRRAHDLVRQLLRHDTLASRDPVKVSGRWKPVLSTMIDAVDAVDFNDMYTISDPAYGNRSWKAGFLLQTGKFIDIGNSTHDSFVADAIVASQGKEPNAVNRGVVALESLNDFLVGVGAIRFSAQEDNQTGVMNLNLDIRTPGLTNEQRTALEGIVNRELVERIYVESRDGKVWRNPPEMIQISPQFGKEFIHSRQLRPIVDSSVAVAASRQMLREANNPAITATSINEAHANLGAPTFNSLREAAGNNQIWPWSVWLAPNGTIFRGANANVIHGEMVPSMLQELGLGKDVDEMFELEDDMSEYGAKIDQMMSLGFARLSLMNDENGTLTSAVEINRRLTEEQAMMLEGLDQMHVEAWINNTPYSKVYENPSVVDAERINADMDRLAQPYQSKLAQFRGSRSRLRDPDLSGITGTSINEAFKRGGYKSFDSIRSAIPVDSVSRAFPWPWSIWLAPNGTIFRGDDMNTVHAGMAANILEDMGFGARSVEDIEDEDSVTSDLMDKGFARVTATVSESGVLDVSVEVTRRLTEEQGIILQTETDGLLIEAWIDDFQLVDKSYDSLAGIEADTINSDLDRLALPHQSKLSQFRSSRETLRAADLRAYLNDVSISRPLANIVVDGIEDEYENGTSRTWDNLRSTQATAVGARTPTSPTLPTMDAFSAWEMRNNTLESYYYGEKTRGSERRRNRTLRWMRRWMTMNFRSRGFLPETIFQVVRAVENEEKAFSKKIRYAHSRLKQAVKTWERELGRDLNQTETEYMYLFLTSPSFRRRTAGTNQIPRYVRAELWRMRNEIDGLTRILLSEFETSDTLRAAAGDPVQYQQLIAAWEDNMGRYVTRSYALHENDDWRKAIFESPTHSALREQAYDYFRAAYRQFLMLQRNQELTEEIRDASRSMLRIINHTDTTDPTQTRHTLNELHSEFFYELDRVDARVIQNRDRLHDLGLAVEQALLNGDAELASVYMSEVIHLLDRYANDAVEGNETYYGQTIHKNRKLFENIREANAAFDVDEEAIAAADLTTQQLEAVAAKFFAAVEEGELAQSGAGLRVGLRGVDLERRDDIPIALRAVMGEDNDPMSAYAKSIAKQARMIASQRMLNRLYQAGHGVFFFDDADPKRPIEANQLLPQTGLYDPISGLYTTPEILASMQDAFQTVLKQQDSVMTIKRGQISGKHGSLTGLIRKGAQQGAMNNLRKAAGWTKAFSTIYSVTTQIRNFQGNLLIMLANGYLNPRAWKNFVTAFQALRSDKKNERGRFDKERYRALLTEYVSLGVVGDSGNFGDLRGILETVTTMDTIDEALLSVSQKSHNKLVGAVKSVAEASQWMYQAADDFYKIVAFETELEDLYRGGLFDRNDPASVAMAKRRAAAIVKQVMPTYSRVPLMIRRLRRSAIIAPFPSFSAEIVRIHGGFIRQASQNLEDGLRLVKEGRGNEGSYMLRKGFGRLFGTTASHVFGDAMVIAPMFMVTRAIAQAITPDPEEPDDTPVFTPMQRDRNTLGDGVRVLREGGTLMDAYDTVTAQDATERVTEIASIFSMNWSINAWLYPVELTADGDIIGIDFGYQHPFSTIRRPVFSLTRQFDATARGYSSGGVKSGVNGAIREMLDPFVQPDLLARAALEFSEQARVFEDPSGNVINQFFDAGHDAAYRMLELTEHDPLGVTSKMEESGIIRSELSKTDGIDRSLDLTYQLGGTLTPGAIKQVSRVARSLEGDVHNDGLTQGVSNIFYKLSSVSHRNELVVEDEVTALMGFRVMRLNVADRFKLFSRTFSNEMGQIKNGYQARLDDGYDQGAALRQRNRSERLLANQFLPYVGAAMELESIQGGKGISVYTLLTESGVNESDATELMRMAERVIKGDEQGDFPEFRLRETSQSIHTDARRSGHEDL